MEQTQKCKTCQVVKPESEFYYYRTAGRRSYYCKSCEKAKSRQYHKDNRQREINRMRVYYYSRGRGAK